MAERAGELRVTVLHVLAQPRHAALLVFAASFLFQLPFFDRWYALLDEGHILLFADIVANGGEIYRDATIYPLPGAFYLLAYAFKVFGASIILSRWIVVLEFSLFVPLVYLWMRRMVSPGWAHGTVVLLWFYRVWCFPHWQMYSYSTTSLLFLLASMLCILKYFDSRSDRLLMAAGLLFGAGVACKQDYGGALLVGAVATLVVSARTIEGATRGSAWRSLATFLLPGAFVGAALAAYFWVQGILPDLVQMTVLNHLRGLSSFEYPEIPDLFPLFGQDPGLRDPVGFFSYFPGLIFTVDAEGVRTSFLYRETAVPDLMLKLFFYGPYLVISAGAVRIWRRRGQIRAPLGRAAFLSEILLFAFGIGVLLVLTFNKPQDYLHFAVVYWPFLCLATVYLHSFLRRRRTLSIVLAASMALPAIAATAYSLALIGRLRDSNSELIPGERSGIHASAAEGRLLTEVVNYVSEHTQPDERVAVIPYFPIVQFLMDRLGPHRSSYIVWPFPEFADRDQRIIRAMEADNTNIIIYNFTQFINFPLMSEFSPDLFAYVVDHYRMDRVFSYDHSGYRLAALQRDDEPVPGSLIVADASRSGALWVEHELGPREPLPPSARGEVIAQERWPFRPVLALRPSADGSRTVYGIDLFVPEAARLESAVGVNPRQWFAYPSYETTYVVAAVDASGRRQELHRRVLRPHTHFDERGWFDFSLPLDAYAGKHIRLLFSTSTQRPEGESIWGGGFEAPRLVVSAAERSPSP